MTPVVSDEDLQKLTELLADATPAPWTHVVLEKHGRVLEQVFSATDMEDVADVPAFRPAHARGVYNAELIVTMRNLLPALLDEVRAYRATLEVPECKTP